MKGESIVTKTVVVAVLTLAAMICFFPGSSRADNITVTVDGAQYDITTVTATFDEDMALLESQPWWGNATLAEDIANAVADDIGTPNDDGTSGPLFAYDDDAIDAFIWFEGSSSSTSVSESLSASWGLCIGSRVCDTGGNVPEPTPLSMLLVGLIPWFWALRKNGKSRRNAPATEA
jgi:hypothetical protein